MTPPERFDDAPSVLQRMAAYAMTYEDWREALEKRIVHFLGLVFIVHVVTEQLLDYKRRGIPHDPPSEQMIQKGLLAMVETSATAILTILHIAATFVLVCTLVHYLCQKVIAKHQPDF